MRKLKALLFLPYKLILLLDLIAAPLIVYALSSLSETHPISLAAYLISAYALTVTAVNFKGIVRRLRELAKGDELALVRGVKALMRRNRYTARYLESREFRAETALYAGLCFDLLYAAIKGGSGLYYHSAWLISIGIYYLVFALIRFFLTRRVKASRTASDKQNEWRTYRTCGVMLFAMNITMGGMAVQMVKQNKANQYSQTLVILSAAYTFYIFTLAIVNVVRFHRKISVILSASKIVAFVGAVMSMYSLQTAMLATFSDGTDDDFRRTANSMTGIAVAAITLTAAVYMIVKGTLALRRSANEE